jgi:hypothetical protein
LGNKGFHLFNIDGIPFIYNHDFSSIEQNIQDAIDTRALWYLNNHAPDGRATSVSQLIQTNQ